MKDLRDYIRFLIEKLEKDSNLLVEPDETAEKEDKEEASLGGVAGVSVPLGAGPHYPSSKVAKSTKKKKRN